MTLWILLTIVWTVLLLFTILAPKKWHAIVLKENTFWLNRNLISKNVSETLVKFETGIWLKVFIIIGLIGFISLIFLTE